MLHPLVLIVLLMVAAVAFAAEDRMAGVDLNHPVKFKTEGFESKQQWERRAQGLREQVLVSTGLWPMPEKAPLNAVIHGKVERDEYTIEKVYFESLPGFYVTGNLYRPKNKTGRLPAVLSPHGHWPNGRFQKQEKAEKQVEIGAERTIEGAMYPLQARCAMLARMGCVVFLYDMVGYADSRQMEHKEGFNDVEAMLRLQSVLGLQLWNSIRGVDFLESLPDVDPKRIGVTGASGGGTQTIVLGIVDPRPVAFFPAVMVSEDMQGGCVCENAPLLRVGTNNAEMVATVAPRGLGMSAANDWTKELLTKGYPQIRRVYELYGAADKVSAQHWPFEHNYNLHAREMMYEVMNRHLGLGWPSGKVTEKPFVPVEPAELSVWDEKHPAPKGDGAKIVRQWMTEQDQKPMKPQAYRDVMRVALREMVHETSHNETDAAPAHRVHRPEGTWNGEAVVWAGGEGAKELLAKGYVVVEVDTLRPEDWKAGTILRKAEPKYAVLTYGYNRSILAERAHDVLKAIRAARQLEGAKQVTLVAAGEMGLAGLVARVLSADVVERAALDVGTFEFDQVTRMDDPNFMPGALKYGGVNGLERLCDTGTTTVSRNGRSAADVARQVISR